LGHGAKQKTKTQTRKCKVRENLLHSTKDDMHKKGIFVAKKKKKNLTHYLPWSSNEKNKSTNALLDTLKFTNSENQHKI
jgi:hypothetical protein